MAPVGAATTGSIRCPRPAPVGSWHLWGNRGALCSPALRLALLEVHRFPSTGPEAGGLRGGACWGFPLGIGVTVALGKSCEPL